MELTTRAFHFLRPSWKDDLAMNDEQVMKPVTLFSSPTPANLDTSFIDNELAVTR